MSPDSECRAIVALNLYPWARGALTRGDAEERANCAIGAMLRYAGVDERRIVNLSDLVPHVGLLRESYGIPTATAYRSIMRANDTSCSREEAVSRVLRILSGDPDPGPGSGRTGAGRSRPSTVSEEDDGAGTLAVLA
jgi:hypothetical protein